MGEVVDFKAVTKPRTRSCKDCRHKVDHPHFRESKWWQCGVRGNLCSEEAVEWGLCGVNRVLWEPIPYEDLPFWRRFGDAVISRIKPKEK